MGKGCSVVICSVNIVFRIYSPGCPPWLKFKLVGKFAGGEGKGFAIDICVS